jgi:phage gpG-like protein
MRLAFNVTGTQRLLDLCAKGPGRIGQALRRSIRKATLRVVGKAMKLVYAGRPDHLNKDRGTFSQSITYEVNEAELWGRVGSNLPYARTHEFGDEVEPHGHPYLTIPLDRMNRYGAREYPEELTYAENKKGTKLLVSAVSGKAVYVLVTSVTIPARPTFGPALKEAAPDVRGELLKAVEEALQ